MSDETADQSATEGQQQPDGQPTLVVNAQYVKDLSFENPNAPNSLLQQDGEPICTQLVNERPVTSMSTS